MLPGRVAGIGQVLEMITDLIFLALALILIPVAFFTADQIRNGTELIVDGTNVTDQDVEQIKKDYEALKQESGELDSRM